MNTNNFGCFQKCLQNYGISKGKIIYYDHLSHKIIMSQSFCPKPPLPIVTLIQKKALKKLIKSSEHKILSWQARETSVFLLF